MTVHFLGPHPVDKLLYPLSNLCMIVSRTIYFCLSFHEIKQVAYGIWDVEKQNYFQKILVYLTAVDKHKLVVTRQHTPPADFSWDRLNFSSITSSR